MQARIRRVLGFGLLAASLLLGAGLAAYIALTSWERRTWLPTPGTFGGVRTETKYAPPAEREILVRTVTQEWSSYTYTVNGRTHWDEVPGSLEWTEPFTVYYDPADPSRSTVSKPASPVPPLITFILCLIGGVAAARAARKPQEEAG